jgi:hypothetical protein
MCSWSPLRQKCQLRLSTWLRAYHFDRRRLLPAHYIVVIQGPFDFTNANDIAAEQNNGSDARESMQRWGRLPHSRLREAVASAMGSKA